MKNLKSIETQDIRNKSILKYYLFTIECSRCEMLDDWETPNYKEFVEQLAESGWLIDTESNQFICGECAESLGDLGHQTRDKNPECKPGGN